MNVFHAPVHQACWSFWGWGTGIYNPFLVRLQQMNDAAKSVPGIRSQISWNLIGRFRQRGELNNYLLQFNLRSNPSCTRKQSSSHLSILWPGPSTGRVLVVPYGYQMLGSTYDMFKISMCD